MPQFTPVDANLAAFSPANFLQGFQQAKQLQEQSIKLKALVSAQEESDALKNDRMAAAKAGYGLDILKASEEKDVAPSLVKSRIATNELNTQRAGSESKDVKFKETQREVLEKANALDNAANAVSAQASFNTAQVRAETAAKQAATGLVQANSAYDAATRAIIFNPGDEQAKRDLVQAEIAVKNAQANKDKADAEHSALIDKAGKPYQDLQAITGQIAKELQAVRDIRSRVVDKDATGKPVTLSEFIQQWEANPDNQAKPDGWFSKAQEAKPLPTAITDHLKEIDDISKRLKPLYATVDALNEKISKAALGDMTKPANSGNSYKTADEAMAAVKAGKIKDGDEVIIDGQKKIWKSK